MCRGACGRGAHHSRQAARALDPLATLRKVHSLLRPGAALAIAAPNQRCLLTMLVGSYARMGGPAARSLLGRLYQDMDFYAEIGESACRPWITVNELREARGFAYRPERLVVQFVARGDDVEVTCRGSDAYPPKA